jgi:hypothetical protein
MARRQVKRTWRSLVKLADARVRVERRALEGLSSATHVGDAVRKLLDQRITDHVAALSRAYAAVSAASAANVGLDDAALRNVEHVGDRMEELSEAIVETRV